MKDYLLEVASKKEGVNNKINVMREYLQAYTLRVMFDFGMFRSLAFVGGTSLRFLYGLPRYSEDLDFSFENKSTPYSFEKLLKKIKYEFAQAGYDITINFNDAKTVQSAFLKFAGLLFEAGISDMKNQNLSVKLEIDTNPPSGANTRAVLVNKFFPISYLSYDISSLFSGKLHALLTRRYTKGRDVFDLGWYLSKWVGIKPNFVQLNNALKQTKWKRELLNADNWKKLLISVVSGFNWADVSNDVTNFIENPADVNIMSKENIISLLS